MEEDVEDHPVSRTLSRDILPYFVSAQRLRHQWFYRLHLLFGYTTDIVMALASIGLATPLLTWMASPNDASAVQKDQAAAAAADFPAFLSGVPQLLYFPLVGFVFVWVALRVMFNREDGQKRAVLAKSCVHTLRQAEAGLVSLLADPEPMPKLVLLMERTVRPTVDRAIQENAWPWTPFAPEIDPEVSAKAADLSQRYKADWKIVAANVQQAAPGVAA